MLLNLKGRITAGLLVITLLTMLIPGSALGIDPVDFDITPIDPTIFTTTVEWSGDEFVESSDNDGSIGNVITVTLDGAGTFNGSDAAIFPASSYTVDNVPDGLSVQIVQVDSKTAHISLTGNASNHTTVNSISDLSIDLSDLISNITLINGSRDDLKITYSGYPLFYIEPHLIPGLFALAPCMTWSDDEFEEAAINDGSISTSLLVTIENATFTGSNASVYEAGDQYTAANLPSGLSIKISKINSQTVKIELQGKANDNQEEDSIDDLNISFKDTAINNTTIYSFVYNQSRNDLKITFDDAAAATTPTYSTIHATITIGSLIYKVNDVPQQMDALPYIANSRTYVPVRYLAYALGLTADDIAWDNATRTVTLVDDSSSTTIQLTIGSKYLFVNGTPTLMDVAPEITSSRTMLPARWVAEALGAVVGWDAATRTVVIDKIIE